MHTIRLRGPWQVEPVARFVLQPDGTYRPVDGRLAAGGAGDDAGGLVRQSLGADFLGRVRYRRTFQKPTGLESGERVWLVVEPPRSRGVHHAERQAARIRRIRAKPAGRFDITDRLEDHNRLEIVVEHPALDAMRSTVGDPATAAARRTGGRSAAGN